MNFWCYIPVSNDYYKNTPFTVQYIIKLASARDKFLYFSDELLFEKLPISE